MIKVIEHCSLCEHGPLKTIWDLPSLPLSETYGEFDGSFPNYNQALQLCEKCGHMQLLNQLPADSLYNQSSYHYSTAKSSSTRARLDSFCAFVSEHVPTAASLQTVVDVGGNDVSLLKRFEAEKKILIDPSLDPQEQESEGVTLLKGFVEQISLADFKPELVVCTHVLEHIANPVSFIRSMLSNSAEDTHYVFEVPCFLKQITALRFDAFFHQHYHYYYPATLQQLVENNGGQVVAMKYNDYPTCGGSIMLVFKKQTAQEKPFNLTSQFLLKGNIETTFQENLEQFKTLNKQISQFILQNERVFGYGASLLLPVIFYHIGEAAKKIQWVLDDDVSKDGIGYKNIEGIEVSIPAKHSIDEDTALLITSYENIINLDALLNKRYPAKRFESFKELQH